MVRLLPRGLAGVLAATVVAGWLVGVVSLVLLGRPQGVPSPSARDCPYSIDDHGVTDCVTEAQLNRHDAAAGLLVGGAGAAFFSFDTAIALSEVYRSRRGAPAPPAGPS